ncbi:MAG: pilus assembly PilX N-terminal domain-containing protein [Myxococcota bacterium]|nr:hypothetical protein [Myxococcales bacterium]
MTTKLRRRYEAARRNGKSERGAALVVAMFLLLLMSFVGIYALDTVALDRQVAGFQNRKRIAFYAAEAAVAEALDSLETTGTPSVGGGNMGDTTLYPYGTPSYAVDPTVANPIAPIGAAGSEGMNLSIGQGGAAKFNLQTWRIQVQGTEPGGTTARIEIAAQRFNGN